MSAFDQADPFGEVAPSGHVIRCFISSATEWAGCIWDGRGGQALALPHQRPEAVVPELSRCGEELMNAQRRRFGRSDLVATYV